MVVAVMLLCIMPLLLAEAMQFALEQLALSPGGAVAVMIGIFFGAVVNLPVYRIERDTEQPYLESPLWQYSMLFPRYADRPRATVVAVNVGGCVIPAGLVLWQIARLVGHGDPTPLTALVVASAVNIFVCYRVARPVHGMGIVMPGFASPAAAIGVTCMLLVPSEYAAWRAPVAFSAGVIGPLVGADLLHLKDLTRVSAGMMSIGGAGTFDGIVLSGVSAAFICGLLN